MANSEIKYEDVPLFNESPVGKDLIVSDPQRPLGEKQIRIPAENFLSRFAIILTSHEHFSFIQDGADLRLQIDGGGYVQAIFPNGNRVIINNTDLTCVNGQLSSFWVNSSGDVTKYIDDTIPTGQYLIAKAFPQFNMFNVLGPFNVKGKPLNISVGTPVGICRVMGAFADTGFVQVGGVWRFRTRGGSYVNIYTPDGKRIIPNADYDIALPADSYGYVLIDSSGAITLNTSSHEIPVGKYLIAQYWLYLQAFEIVGQYNVNGKPLGLTISGGSGASMQVTNSLPTGSVTLTNMFNTYYGTTGSNISVTFSAPDGAEVIIRTTSNNRVITINGYAITTKASGSTTIGVKFYGGAVEFYGNWV